MLKNKPIFFSYASVNLPWILQKTPRKLRNYFQEPSITLLKTYLETFFFWKLLPQNLFFMSEPTALYFLYLSIFQKGCVKLKNFPPTSFLTMGNQKASDLSYFCLLFLTYSWLSAKCLTQTCLPFSAIREKLMRGRHVKNLYWYLNVHAFSAHDSTPTPTRHCNTKILHTSNTKSLEVCG